MMLFHQEVQAEEVTAIQGLQDLQIHIMTGLQVLRIQDRRIREIVQEAERTTVHPTQNQVVLHPAQSLIPQEEAQVTAVAQVTQDRVLHREVVQAIRLVHQEEVAPAHLQEAAPALLQEAVLVVQVQEAEGKT